MDATKNALFWLIYYFVVEHCVLIRLSHPPARGSMLSICAYLEPFNAFRSLLGIAGDVTAQTYAELYSAKSRNTTSSVENHN